MNDAIKTDLQSAVAAVKNIMGSAATKETLTSVVNIAISLGFTLVETAIPAFLDPIVKPILTMIENEALAGVDTLVAEELAKVGK
jgi:hypothetical protein